MITIDPSITVSELLERFPSALPVFIQLRMLCVGCPTKGFHSLADVARIHGCSLQSLIQSIEAAVNPRRN